MQKTQLIGNLGNDPELRETQGKKRCAFSVATTERWKDKEGNRKERVEWHRVVTWDGLALTCANYLKKGARVYIEGKNRTRKYTDQNGVERSITEVVAYEMEMLGNPGNDSTVSTPNGPPTVQDDVPF